MTRKELFDSLPRPNDGNPYYVEMSFETFNEVLDQALLAERERCAKILLTKHENHPQDGVNWDGTYYDLYEQILAGG